MGKIDVATRRTAGASATVAVLAMLFVVACSDADLPAGGLTDGPLGRETVADAIAQWRCDGFATCCEDAGIELDRATCLEVQRGKRLQKWSKQEAFRFGFDQEGAAECARALSDTTPTCPPGLAGMCGRVFDGILELGEPCTRKRQCRGWHQGRVACIDGRCAQRRAPGDDCARVCDDAGNCSGRGVCDLCRTGSRCSTDEAGNQRCVVIETRTVGEGGNCHPPQQPFPVGTESITKPECDEGLWCGPASGGDGEVCRPLVSRGGRCGFFVPCEPELVCSDGVCADPVPQTAGEPCSSDRACASARCAAGICATRVIADLGEACPDGRECADGLFCHPIDVRCTRRAPLGQPCAFRRDFYRACAADLVCHFDFTVDPAEGRCVTPEVDRCLRATQLTTAHPRSG